MRPLVYRIFDPIVGGLVFGVYRLVELLPVDFSSALVGRLARLIGPLLGPHRVARDNLRAAFPEKPEAEIATILDDMWDNLGRTFGEYPHLAKLIRMGRIDVVGMEHLHAIRDDGQAGLLWSGHIGNWEMVSAAPGMAGILMHRIYRAPNNPHMDWMFRRRGDVVQGELFPKGAEGARNALKILKKGEHLGMLVDQKMNDGIAVPFFGRAAMTAPALVAFALRYKCPVVSLRTVRLGGARFRVEVSAPYTFESTGDRAADELAGMTAVNRQLETWIREYPAQWLWVHRRWPKPGSAVPSMPETH